MYQVTSGTSYHWFLNFEPLSTHSYIQRTLPFSTRSLLSQHELLSITSNRMKNRCSYHIIRRDTECPGCRGVRVARAVSVTDTQKRHCCGKKKEKQQRQQEAKTTTTITTLNSLRSAFFGHTHNLYRNDQTPLPLMSGITTIRPGDGAGPNDGSIFISP